MTRIFGAVWVFLGHESQIPENDDFVRTRLGPRAIILVRDSQGTIRALYNRCTHRGSTACRRDRGRAKSFMCGYHGWSFFNSDKIQGVPWAEGYATDFGEEKFNLAQVPRVESYRGFVFGTLNLDAPDLTAYLDPVARPDRARYGGCRRWRGRRARGGGRPRCGRMRWSRRRREPPA